MAIRRRRFRVCMVMVLAGLTAGCGASPVSPEGAEPLTVTRLRQEALAYTFHSGFSESRRIVVRNAPRWREIWSSVWQGHSEPPALPAVDFEREMIVVAAMGERPTGGYNILIESASESAGGVVVRVRSISPGPGCAVTLAVTRPVDIARLPRRDRSITFDERIETRACNP